MIEEDAERAIQYVAEPIGVVLALLPITNPTSTALFKSIVAAKTRNAVIFRPSARAARCATRAIEILQRAGEAEGLPPGALQVIPDPTLEASQYLFHHPDVDLIWTTGGPKAVAAANAAGKPCISVGAGNAPVYLHASADVPMAVVDLLISKTFDASVICPAEQTCVVDDAIHDAVVAELERLGARVLDAGGGRAPRRRGLRRRRPRPPWPRSGAPAPTSPRWPGSRPGDAKVLVAPLPADLATLALHPLLQEKLMPVLGLVRSPSVEHALAVCELVTEHGGLGHTSAVYARDEAVVQALRRPHPHRPHPRQRADRGRRARRHLHRHAADVLARLRHLGRLDHDRQRQLPQPAQHQGRLAPAGAAAVVPRAVGHLLQRRRAGQPAHAGRADRRDRHRRADPGPRGRRRGAPSPRAAMRCT